MCFGARFTTSTFSIKLHYSSGSFEKTDSILLPPPGPPTTVVTFSLLECLLPKFSFMSNLNDRISDSSFLGISL